MKAKILLRIAAALILIHLIGHTLGHTMWDKPDDPKMQEVVSAMKSYKADFMGATKSMADYYHGYSLMMLLLYGFSIVILWFASGFVNSQPAIARKVIYPIGVSYLIFGGIEYLYFFPFAASMSFLAGALAITAVALNRA
jgi:hypothetical protein